MNIEVNTNAHAFNQEEITINAPVERIYNILSNISGWPEWQTGVKKAKMEGDTIENKSFVWKAGGMTIKSKIHTVIPNREIGWTGKSVWINAVHNWYFEKRGDNTLVKVSECLEGFGAGLMKKSLKKGMIKSLQELKDVAEDGH